VGRAVHNLRPLRPGGGFLICRQKRFAVRNVRPNTRSSTVTCASSAFGPLEVRYAPRAELDAAELKRRIQAGPFSIWRYADFLPVEHPQSALGAGWTPLVRARRLAESSASASSGSRTMPPNPTHSFKDRVVSVALARAQELGFTTIACASTGNLANAVAAHAAAAGLESYVFIPSDLEEQKVLATGIYGTNLVAVNGNYDDVNRLCTEIAERPRLGVREHQHEAVLLRGLEDLGV